MIDSTGELLAVGLFAAICGGLVLGYPVAFTLAGVSLLFAVLGHAFGHFDLIFFMSLAPRFFGVMLNETLVAVPLFIFMGLVLERSRHRREPAASPWASSSGACAGAWASRSSSWAPSSRPRPAWWVPPSSP